MKNKQILILLSIIFAIFQFYTLKNGHNWGDDFAQYIRHAQNLIDGKPYSEGITLDPAVIPPPGYPLLLAGIINMVGTNFIAFKALNVVSWLVFVWALYYVIQRRLSTDTAAIICVFFLTSPYFFWFKQNILSDLPFLALSAWSVALFDGYSCEPIDRPRKKPTAMFAGALALALAAFLIRWFGGIIFLSALIYFAMKRRYREALVIIVSFTLALLIFWLYGMSLSFNLTEASVHLTKFPEVLAFNSQNILEELLLFIFPFKTRIADFLFSLLAPITPILGWLVILGLGTTFAIGIRKRSLKIDMVFVCLGYSAVLFWPITADVRYVLPFAGWLLIQSISGINGLPKIIEKWPFSNRMINVAKRIPTILLVLMILHNTISVTLNYNFDDDAVNRRDFQQLLNWVKTGTGSQDRIMFFKPKALSLFSNRPCANFDVQFDPRSVATRILDLHIQYVILNKPASGPALDRLYYSDTPLAEQTKPLLMTMNLGNLEIRKEIEFQKIRLREIWQNDRFVAFEVVFDMNNGV